MHSPLYRQPPKPLGKLSALLYRRPYPGAVESVPATREHFTRAARAGGLDPELTETALLCLSELATNAVRHAARRFIVTVSVRGTRQRCVRVEVHDTYRSKVAFPSCDSAFSVLGELGAEATGGRGLAMVAMMADRTGVEQDCNGKSVWFELRLGRSEVTSRT